MMQFDLLSFGHIFKEMADVVCYASEPGGRAGMIGAGDHPLPPFSLCPQDGLSGSVKLEGANLQAVLGVTKRLISALPVIYRTAKVTAESEASGA
jgi:hypothetical protein